MNNQPENIYHKKFDEASFKDSDPQSRKAVLTFMNSKGFNFYENPNKYGIDILSDTLKKAFELERRKIWVGGEYQYETYHFLHRKLHLFQGDKEYTPYFMVLNKEYNEAMFINQQDLIPHLTEENYKVIKVWNYRESRYDNESIYDVPISAFTLMKF